MLTFRLIYEIFANIVSRPMPRPLLLRCLQMTGFKFNAEFFSAKEQNFYQTITFITCFIVNDKGWAAMGYTFYYTWNDNLRKNHQAIENITA